MLRGATTLDRRIGNFNFAAPTLGFPARSARPIPASEAARAFRKSLGIRAGIKARSSLQLSGAAHQLRTSARRYPRRRRYSHGWSFLPAFPVATSQDYGFAVQLGTLHSFCDKVAPELFASGDQLWLQPVMSRARLAISPAIISVSTARR